MSGGEDGWARLVKLLDEREIVLRTTGERLNYLAPTGAMDEEVTGLVRAHRERLLTTLTGAGAALAAAPAGAQQRRMHGSHAHSADPAVWNITQRITLRGPLEPERLTGALTALTERHESLRTRFLDTDLGVLQQVLANTPVELPVEDLRGLTPAGRAAALAEATDAEIRRPFDLAAPPLLRTRLLRPAEREWVLLLTVHHIAIDGWSLATVLDDLGALYRTGGPLPEEPGRMTDHACWERTVVNRAAITAAADHWAGVLRGAELSVDLPTDRPRPEQRSGHGETLGFRIPAAVAEAVGRYSAARSTTASAVLVAALARLFGSLSGAPQILLLLSNANRTRAADEKVVGLITSSMPILVPTGGDGGFAGLVDHAAEAIASAIDHTVTPFGLLLEPLRERGVHLPSSFPQILFAVQSTPPIVLDLPGLTAEVEDLPGPSARADCALNVTPDADGYAGLVEYDTDLFDRSTMLSWLDALVAGLAEQLEVPLG
ncbi:condensation domain-containing protein [Kitasatospora brasiliensis]|uniref:condensation domain-containing protein n=1 Tax=Kitasatospora brasiliensis TaxID=3058040 RepID=UPI00292EAD6E|nr:condensation domain-containing protein [Kitasatospora sp. K002]